MSAITVAEDRRYLVTRGQIYWLQLATPRKLHDRYRQIIQKTLGTSSLKEAQTLRWAWVTAYKLAWEKAATDESMTAEEIEALAVKEHERQTRLESGSL